MIGVDRKEKVLIELIDAISKGVGQNVGGRGRVSKVEDEQGFSD